MQGSILTLIGTCLQQGSPRVKSEAVALFENALSLATDNHELEPYRALIPELLKVTILGGCGLAGNFCTFLDFAIEVGATLELVDRTLRSLVCSSEAMGCSLFIRVQRTAAVFEIIFFR